MVLSSEQRSFLVKLLHYYKRFKLHGTIDYSDIVNILTVGSYTEKDRDIINNAIAWYVNRLERGFK